ncbi:MAG: ABC transporter permease [Streptomyces sp.]|uniref:FtsX-like permease family protein n=1 Tax=Streptomyces sp. TaxID=1931 RepID=UPI0025D9D313|nr:FtsX-like permease family protein [Streptomyces sp.]MBW8801584.1 ABC transporter permease [Streptomyces sp.]
MSAWRLGIRLALQGNRVRLVVTAVAVSFTVAFLLGALGAMPARQAKLDRIDARSTVSVGAMASRGLPAPAARVTIETADGWYRGKPLTVRLVNAEPGALLPPGLRRYPRAGEAIVSPDLAADLRRHPEELASRVHGRVVGTIAESGLAGPHELYAYVGVGTVPAQAQPVQYFGHHHEKPLTPIELRLAAWLGALGLLLPVLVLVATATRLSASSRDRRLSALRLVGATPRQARTIAAAEGLLAGIAGVAGGLAVFWLLRGPACALLPFPEGVYAQDLMPTAAEVAAVLVGVPLLAVVSAVLSLRKVVMSPLGLRRSARVRGVGWWRLLPVATGLGMLIALRLNHHAWPPGDPTGTTLLLGGGGLTLIGLAVAAPAMSRLGAGLLSRLPWVSAGLAARRIDSDPSASARVVTGMVLVVFSAAWLLAFLPVLQGSRTSSDVDLVHLLPKGTLTTATDLGAVDVAGVRRVPGVRSVVAVGTAQLAPPGWKGDNGNIAPDTSSRQVAIGSCTDLATTLRRDIGCTDAKVYRLATPYGAELAAGSTVGILDDNDRISGHFQLPARIPVLHVPLFLQYSGLADGELLIDPELLPRARGTRLFATTDGTTTTVERTRAAMPFVLAMTSQTPQEAVSGAAMVYEGYLRAVRIGLVLALLVGAASLAVTTADAVHERRRSLATLVAFGTPLRTLRRSVLLQMAAPMLTNVLAALGAAAVASACYLGLTEDAWTLPWGGWGLTALAAVAAVLLATAATLPLVSAVGRPEALRAE